MNTGDIHYLESNKEAITAILDQLLSKIDENGSEILDGNRFLDWPTSPNPKAVHAGLQSLMIMAFNAGAEMSTIFNEVERKEQYLATVQVL